MANLNNPAVKRIMGELKELTQGARPDDQFVVVCCDGICSSMDFPTTPMKVYLSSELMPCPAYDRCLWC